MVTGVKAVVPEGIELLDRKLPPEGKITFEEFLAWAGEDDWAEWVDGEVILLMPESRAHQRLLVFLVSVMQTFATARGVGEVVTNMIMRLVTRPSGRVPDALFLRNEHLARLHETHVDGPGDLVVEIVSPDSQARDREDTFKEYAAAGIPEYWLLDVEQQDAAFYQLGPDGVYRRVQPDASGVYRSAVFPGFWVRVSWLWQDPPPQIQALQELGLLQGYTR